MDRISQLPEALMLEILLRLPPIDSVRLKITSRTWNSLPISYFCPPIFSSWDEHSVSSIDQSLRKLHELHPKNIFHCFTLHEYLFDESNDSHVYRWIKLATKHCLNQLDLHIYGQQVEYYSFPIFDFDFGSLIVLRFRCILVKPFFPGERKRFNCLKELRLHVDLTRLSVVDVLSMCPSLEILDLRYCYNINYLQLCDFPKLKQVYLTPRYYRDIYRYKIEAANLETLHLETYHSNCQCYPTCQCSQPVDLEVVRCSNLKELIVMTPGSTITHQYVEKLTRKFPHLEVLSLEASFGSPKLLISSHQLRKLTLHLGSNPLEEVNLHTPNLAFCTYSNKKIHLRRFLLDSTKLEELNVRLDKSDFPKGLDFFITLQKRFREFAAQERSTVFINGSEIKLCLKLLREEPSVPEIMQLQLKPRDDFTREDLGYCFSTLLDNLLRSCHPMALSITENGWILKAICKKFMSWEENSPCCRDNSIKCWRHYLKSIEIQSMNGRDADLSIQAIHIQGVDSISFALRWLVPDN